MGSFTAKNKMFLSVISRFLIFLVLLILIVFIQNIGVNLYARQYISRYILSEKKGVLSVQMSQIDKELTMLNDWIVQTVSENEDFLRLAYMTGTDSDDYRLVNSYISLGNYFDNKLKQSAYEQGFFSCFPQRDILLFRGYDKNMSDYLTKLCKKAEIKAKTGWSIVQSDGKSYILGIYEKGGACCGAWVSMDFLLYYIDSEINKNQKQEEDLVYAFTDKNGTIISWLGENPGACDPDDVPFGEKVLSLESQKITVSHKAYDSVYTASDFLDIYLVELVGKEAIAMEMPGIYVFFVIFSLLTLGVGTVFIIWVYKSMIKPLRRLNKAIVSVEAGNLSYRIRSVAGKNEFDVLNREFNTMLEQVKHLKLDIYEMTIEQQRTKLRYLSQQIQPHFILNVLNILYSYEAKDHEQIQQMILYLSRYFRYIVNIHSDEVPLGEEFKHVENYLKIQKVRYPYQFNYDFKMDEALQQASILPLLIQTFVENSIKHAVSAGRVLDIFVKASDLHNGNYRLVIYDTGKGYPPSILEDIQSVLSGREGGKNLGIGMINAVRRLQIIYGEQIKIIIRNRESEGAYAEFIFPLSLDSAML